MYIRFLLLTLLASITAFGAGVKTADPSNFQEQVADGVTLVDFYGTWCGPCKRMAPVLDQLAEEMEGKVTFVKVNEKGSHSLIKEHEVQAFPTLVLFKNGKETGRLVGFRDKSAIRKFIESGGKG